MAGIKLTHTEVDERVNKCFELRFKTTPPIHQKEWIKYCHEHYNDKSEKQYHKYWSDAKEKYEEGWRAKLNNLLDPAIDELFSLLADDDAKIRQKAVDQIVKYTGNDIQKIEAKVQGNIQLNWGNDPGLQKLEIED